MQWYDEGEREIEKAEKELISYTGIMNKDFKSYKVQVDWKYEMKEKEEKKSESGFWDWLWWTRTDQSEYESKNNTKTIIKNFIQVWDIIILFYEWLPMIIHI